MMRHQPFSISGRPFQAAGVVLLLSSLPLPVSGEPDPGLVRLVAVGDICIGRGVQREASRQPRGYPFARIASVLRQADIAFGNLECVLSNRGTRVPKKYNFRASPTWASRLRAAGFDALSLANNHTMDYGRTALRDTVQAVRKADILAVGAGTTPEDAHQLRILQVGGRRVGFLAYLGMFPPILPLLANEPWVAMGYPANIRRDVRAARAKTDILIVSVHAGVELRERPSPRQREICRAAVDAGADVVLGHHPHRVQPVERYRGKVIFYSLGNFVFDPSPVVLRNPSGPWGAMAVIEWSPEGMSHASLVPLRIADRQPRIAGTAREVVR